MKLPIVLPCQDDLNTVTEAINKFNQTKEIVVVRETPKKRKEIEIKQYLPKAMQYNLEDNTLNISLNIKITSTGTTKPNEILDVLKNEYKLNISVENALVCRTGLYHQGKALIDID